MKLSCQQLHACTGLQQRPRGTRGGKCGLVNVLKYRKCARRRTHRPSANWYRQEFPCRDWPRRTGLGSSGKLLLASRRKPWSGPEVDTRFRVGCGARNSVTGAPLTRTLSNPAGCTASRRVGPAPGGRRDMDQLATLAYALEELRGVVARLDDAHMDIVTNCEPWTVRRLASHALNNQLLWAGLVTGQELVSAEDT